MGELSMRTNEEWVVALREPGAQRAAALEDLRVSLLTGLRYALASRSELAALDAQERNQLYEDFAQSSLTRILDHLDTFRGESLFITWAKKVSVRVALTELRRRHWRDVSLEQLTQGDEMDITPVALADPAPNPEQVALRNSIMATLERVIMEELTEKQRTVMMAARIHDMPLEEVAERIGSNRGAVYKMLHDARRRLKKRLEAEGLTMDEVLEAFG